MNRVRTFTTCAVVVLFCASAAYYVSYRAWKHRQVESADHLHIAVWDEQQAYLTSPGIHLTRGEPIVQIEVGAIRDCAWSAVNQLEVLAMPTAVIPKEIHFRMAGV